ncbi:MAG TPA: hypothetical protein PK267_07620, partial [Atribacterota bacterium]|nr:hypothetical protein [Atribacterota bacterium]
MKHKAVVIFSLPLLLLVILIAATVSASGQDVMVDEWKIPFLNSVTGPIASIGEYMSWSANRAA